MTTLAILFLAQAGGGKPSLALSTASELRLLGDDMKLVRQVETAAQPIAWSPDARTLALIDAQKDLFTLDVPGKDADPVPVGHKAETAVWTKEGRLLFDPPGKGIWSLTPGGRPVSLIPNGRFPAPSPDGAALAFTTTGSSGGVWVARSDGRFPHRIARGRAVGAVSWSYDGRWLASVVDGRLKLMRPTGRRAQDLGAVAHGRIAWSAGSPYLLAQRAKGWAVWDFGSAKWSPLDFGVATMPQWVGPRRLLGIKGARAVETILGSSSAALPPQGPVVAALRAVGPYMGSSLPDPFARAPRPGRGQTAWRGRLISVDADERGSRWEWRRRSTPARRPDRQPGARGTSRCKATGSCGC